MPLDHLRLKNPIVLIHGLGAKRSLGPIDYFFGLPRKLRNAGNELYIADLTAWHSIETRAAELRKQLWERFPEGTKVNLVGHSLGGLDARYAVSKLGLAENVASVTTIGTPNRGSTLGDFTLDRIPEKAVEALEKVVSVMKWSNQGFRQIGARYHQTEAGAQLAPDVPGVAYFSATSAIGASKVRTALPLFWLPHELIRRNEGDNDGFVSVESAKWGQHICTYVGDHYGQIGQFLGRSRGLDYLKFYDEIFSCLKREGF